MDSDIDVVVLADGPAPVDPDLWSRLLAGRVVRERDWGPLREIRVVRPSGFEVEVGVVPLSWADTEPVDAGTSRVMKDGYRIVYDPDGALAALANACGDRRGRGAGV